MFGLRQKLAFGFGGLLALLLVVSGLGIVVLSQYRGALDKFFFENWRSVQYGQHVIEAVGQLDEIAHPLATDPSAAELAAAARGARGPLDDASENCAEEDQNITLDGEREMATALTLAWSGRSLDGRALVSDGYRDAFGRLLDPHVTGAARAAAAAAVQRRSAEVRRQAKAVVDLNLANMRPINGRARQMANRATLLMVAMAAAGVGLAVAFTVVMARSILRPLATVIRSIREIEQGNLDLVVQVRTHDEIHQLAEAFNSMAAKLREYRRTNRAKLIRTQQTTQLAVDSLPDAVAVTGPDGAVELSNEAARRLFGLTEGVDVASTADRRLAEVYREVVASGRPSRPRGYESAIEVYGAGGQLRFFLPHAVPICDGDAKPVGITLVLADVTNLRRLDEMKSGLLSVVSHELKTPLTSIRMAVHLMLEERVGPLTAKQAELMTAAREDSERLDKIVTDLLDMGRMESGRAELDLRPVPVARLVDDSVAPLAVAFRDKGIELAVDVSPDAGAVMVDPSRIHYVLANLLNNALKFTDAGGRVRVSAEAGGIGPDGDGHVRLTVEDTGIGIPADHLPRVFDRFFRVPGGPPTNGAGLGLAIAKEIVTAHGGAIAVRSALGRGTRFDVTLCRARDPRPQRAAEPAVRRVEVAV